MARPGARPGATSSGHWWAARMALVLALPRLFSSLSGRICSACLGSRAGPLGCLKLTPAGSDVPVAGGLAVGVFGVWDGGDLLKARVSMSTSTFLVPGLARCVMT